MPRGLAGDAIAMTRGGRILGVVGLPEEVDVGLLSVEEGDREADETGVMAAFSPGETAAGVAFSPGETAAGATFPAASGVRAGARWGKCNAREAIMVLEKGKTSS